MQVNEYKVYFKEYTHNRVYLGDRVENITLDIDAGYDHDFYFTFEDMNESYPRTLYEFPEGTTFHFKGQNAHINIEKELYQTNKVLVLPFLSEETNVPYSTTSDYIIDYVRPDGRKFPLVGGILQISK